MVASDDKELIMSGNEALARGAIEAGIGFCSSYPGTPATEITSTLMREAKKYDIYVEWSANEKVALEAAAGASWSGVPALCPMKSLGLNVASDFLLNFNITGSGPGGLVIIVADDPRGHSSSTDQDSRFYSKAAYLPLLEPTCCQQAKDIIPYSFEISRKFQVPVIIRTTIRLNHSGGLVRVGKISEKNWEVLQQLPKTLYNVPNPHLHHKDLLAKLEDVEKEFLNSPWNRVINGKGIETLMISSGVCQLYSEEALRLTQLKNTGMLGLVTTYPLPRKTIRDALKGTKNVLFVEEIDPFIEDETRSALLDFFSTKETALHGKRTGLIPAWGEMNTDIITEALGKIVGTEYMAVDSNTTKNADKARELLVDRSLTFCPGCTHTNVYWALHKVKKRLGGKLSVTGDIGCYSLGVFYDDILDTLHAMGSGIGVACGLGQLDRFGLETKIAAVAGDSTFFHACLPALVNARHQNANMTFLILDNSTTAMTGFQPHPGSKEGGSDQTNVSIEKVVKSIGPDFMAIGDATDIDSLVNLLHSTIDKKGLNVLVLNSICRIFEQKQPNGYTVQNEVYVETENCHGEECKICVRDFACSALGWNEGSHVPIIIDQLCIHCGACLAVCPHGALRER
jgi:indolepyruvate ferredoxin oxidoreductase alpha subunit